MSYSDLPSELKILIAHNCDSKTFYNLALADSVVGFDSLNHPDHYKNLFSKIHIEEEPFTKNLIVLSLLPDGTKHGKCCHYGLRYSEIERKVRNTNFTRMYYNSDGSLLEESFYKNGKLDDESILYYPDGKVHKRCTFYEDVPHGTFTSYYPSGSIKTIKYYNNGKINGVTKSWYDNGLLKKVCVYKNETKHGETLIYYSNGQIKEQYSEEDGFLSGIYKSWYENGNVEKISSHLHIKHGNGIAGIHQVKYDGEYKSYYSNGIMNEHKFYKYGNLHGDCTSWHENGVKKCQCKYKNGVFVGKYETWSDDGTLTFTTNYSNLSVFGLSSFYKNL